MASYSTPRIKAFFQDGATAVPANVLVKLSTDGQHVTVCGASDVSAIGVSMNAGASAGDRIEVALQGGGAKLKLGTGGAALGGFLKAASGGVGVAGATGNFCAAQAMEAGVAGDIIGVEVSQLTSP
jgi:hypothetical protein